MDRKLGPHIDVSQAARIRAGWLGLDAPRVKGRLTTHLSSPSQRECRLQSLEDVP
jgi:hypothetical protein